MKFYNKNHQYYCGIDLHARSLYVCILDNDGCKFTAQDKGGKPFLLNP